MQTIVTCAEHTGSALDHAPIGAFVVDQAGVIGWANSAAAALLDEPDAAALRHTLFFALLPEADAGVTRQMFDLYFATPADMREPRFREVSLVTASGAVQTAEISIAPSNDRGGTTALVFARSLTQQIVAERRFSQVFDGLPLGLIVIDARQCIVRTNRSANEIFGYRPEDLIGQPLSVLVPDRYREGHGAHVANYAASPSSRRMGSGRDLTALHRSGREFPVEIALTVFASATGPFYMAIVSDISQRKRAECALQQTNAQLEEFTYVASHDLRSPLRGIGDLAGWIREDLGEQTLPEAVRHNFDRIALRIGRCEQMIDDLLDYARAGVRDPQMSVLEPRDLVEEAIALANVPDSFTIETQIAGAALRAPRAPLSACLRNLVANAVKHHGGAASTGGRIRISVRDEGRFCVFCVEDDGQGVPPGNEDRIFKLFHRASPKTEGDGVGLAFTRRMINAHGGMISVIGKGKLGGASFEIHWPRILLKEQEDDRFD